MNNLKFLIDFNSYQTGSINNLASNQDNFIINSYYTNYGNNNLGVSEEFQQEKKRLAITNNSSSDINYLAIQVKNVPINTRLIFIYVWETNINGATLNRISEWRYYGQTNGSSVTSAAGVRKSPGLLGKTSASTNTKYLTYAELIPFYNIKGHYDDLCGNNYIQLLSEYNLDMTSTDTTPAGYTSSDPVYNGRSSPSLYKYIESQFKILFQETIYLYNVFIYLDSSPLIWSNQNKHLSIFNTSKVLTAPKTRLYLPGELIEKNSSQLTEFTKSGNLLIQNDFMEGIPLANAYKDHFEIYELIEY